MKNINIDDLTIGQAKEILSLLKTNNETPVHRNDILSKFIGEKVLVRDHKAGVFITILEDIRGKEWVGAVSRKIHWWEKAGAVEGIAETGIDLDKSRITVKTKDSNGKELIQICPVSDEIYDELMGAKEWNPK